MVKGKKQKLLTKKAKLKHEKMRSQNKIGAKACVTFKELRNYQTSHPMNSIHDLFCPPSPPDDH